MDRYRVWVLQLRAWSFWLLRAETSFSSSGPGEFQGVFLCTLSVCTSGFGSLDYGIGLLESFQGYLGLNTFRQGINFKSLRIQDRGFRRSPRRMIDIFFHPRRVMGILGGIFSEAWAFHSLFIISMFPTTAGAEVAKIHAALAA